MGYKVTVISENQKDSIVDSHDVWELLYCAKGNGILTIENEDYSFSEGAVFCIPPKTEHSSGSSTEFVNLCIHADVTIHHEGLIYKTECTVQERHLFEMIQELYFSPPKYANVITNLIAALAGLIEVNCSRNCINPKIKSVYDEISVNFMHVDFNPAKLIEKTGYSDDYFRSIFMKQYNTTPKAYLEKLRMEYAMRLIRTYGNKLKIYEIAERCGYCDPLYFSKRFRQFMGVSPQSYINEIVSQKNSD